MSQKVDQEVYTFQAGWVQILTFFTGVLLSFLAVIIAIQLILKFPTPEVFNTVLEYNNAVETMQQSGSSVIQLLDLKIDVSKKILAKIWYIWSLPLMLMTITVMTVLALNYRSVTAQLLEKLNQYRYMYTQERKRKKQAFAELEHSEEHLYKVHEQLSEGFIALNKEERIMHANRMAVQYLAKWAKGSRSLKAYKGQLLETYIPGYMLSGLSVSIRDGITKKLSWQKEIYIEPLKTWLDIRIYPSAEEGVYLYFRDISDTKDAGNVTGKKSESVLKNISESTPSPFAIVDRQWNYLIVSNAWKDSFLPVEDELIGKNHRALLPNFPGRWQPLEKELLQNKTVRSSEMPVQVENREEWVSWEIRPWNVNGQIEGFMLFANIITHLHFAQEKSKNQREREHKLAYHDILTGLPNRQLFYDRLSMALAHAYRHLGRVGLFFLDLDGFKGINDNLGHDVGDMLLKETAERLKHCVRETDTVARLGGDEFTIILNGITDDKDAALVAEKIIKNINKTFHLSGHEVHVSTSIGISLYPSNGTTTTDLIKKADNAMYWSKEHGKNQYTFYSENELDGGVQVLSDEKKNKNTATDVSQRELEGQIRVAQQKGELEVYFQPQYDPINKKVVGMESLLRWNHPQLGQLLPRSFLTMSENTGAILPIGEWVIHETCLKVREWKEKFDDQPFYFSINFSKRQLLDESLLTRVQKAFTDTDVDYVRMLVEISEELLTENDPDVRQNIERLSKLGCQIYVDDFGLHYTPMMSLQQWPLSGIKIHRDFVQNALKSVEERTTFKALLSLAESLKLRTICEGVETKEQYDFLVKDGGHLMQGYYIAEPMEDQRIPAFFKQTVKSK